MFSFASTTTSFYVNSGTLRSFSSLSLSLYL